MTSRLRLLSVPLALAAVLVPVTSFARLNIFGTTVLDKDWQLPPLCHEWKPAEGSTA